MDFPIKEEIKAFLVRLWFSGLVCYLVLWGSRVSNDFLDLLLLLPIAHFICDVILTNTIIRAVFKTRLNLQKKYSQMKSFQRVKVWVYSYLEVFLSVLIVIGLYEGINRLVILIGGLDKLTVPFPVEPFGYAFIYTFVYYIFYFIKYKFMLNLLQGRNDVSDL
ncbi:MAG: hypothetical protein K2O23_00855 [Anaeroplasmataceae bacterium]|nr:hypothetical protein [Anaeroplasmataceae bacterium]